MGCSPEPIGDDPDPVRQTVDHASVRTCSSGNVGTETDDPSMAHLGHSQRGSKQHAQLRGDRPRLRALWVYDEEDWTLMRSLPTGSLICPVPGCSNEFQIPQQNRHGTRFLKDRPGHGCSHTPARPDLGGGQMSAQHRWMQARIARILESIGQAVVTEHAETNSDVFVPDVGLAIEIQRWSTGFAKRTEARIAKGATVLWIMTEDAKGTETDRALFSYPAVRVRVRDWDDSSVRLTPWEDNAQNRRARLSFYGTVASADKNGRLSTGKYDARQFLSELVESQRQWYPAGTPGLPHHRASWILNQDLQAATDREARHRARLQRWRSEQLDWDRSRERAALIKRWGQIPPVIEDFGKNPRGIDAHPVRWHAVLYDRLLREAAPSATFSIEDCWRHLEAAGIPSVRGHDAGTASLMSFLVALEAAFLLARAGDRWRVCGRHLTRDAQSHHDERPTRAHDESDEMTVPVAAPSDQHEDHHYNEDHHHDEPERQQSHTPEPLPPFRAPIQRRPDPVTPNPFLLPDTRPAQTIKRGRLRRFFARLVGR